MTETLMRGGHVALLGRPNVGKSTLFNRLLGTRTVAVTHKPHTTRCNVRGIIKDADCRVVLIDTPGMHRNQRHRLSSILNRNILHALDRMDLCVLIIECRQWDAGDAELLELIKQSGKPCVLLLNKVDRLSDKTKLFEMLNNLNALHDFAALIPTSALRDKSFVSLKNVMRDLLPEMTAARVTEDEDEMGDSDQRARRLAEEIIREQVMLDLHKEVPYASHVRVTMWQKKEQVMHCVAQILVERESQKAIVLGRGGQNIKRIGSQARRTLEILLDCAIYLELQVKVHAAWRNDPEIVRAYMDDKPI